MSGVVISKGTVESRKNGRILIIRPETPTVPLFCGLCEFPIKTLDDVISCQNHQVCNKCEMRWSGQKEWKSGWKPDKNSQEWLEYIQERKLLSRNLISFR